MKKMQETIRYNTMEGTLYGSAFFLYIYIYVTKAKIVEEQRRLADNVCASSLKGQRVNQNLKGVLRDRLRVKPTGSRSELLIGQSWSQ